MILNVLGEDFEWRGNCMQKVFAWTRHGGLVVGIRTIEFLYDFIQMEVHYALLSELVKCSCG